jgi:hypothetical protein
MTARVPTGWRWVLLAAVTGFAASAALSAWLGLERRLFVAAWTAVVAIVWAAYARSEGTTLRSQLARHRIAGLIVGGVLGAMLAFTVARQPASAAPGGLALLTDLLWLGVVYGSADALILSILPALALYGARPVPARWGRPRGCGGGSWHSWAAPSSPRRTMPDSASTRARSSSGR